MTTDESARLRDICRTLRRIVDGIDDAESLHEASELSAWAVNELMSVQKMSAHRMRIMRSDLKALRGY